MIKALRSWFLVGMVFCSLMGLVACNGDGGGTPIVPPGDGTQPPGDGTQPPGDGTQPPAVPVADTFTWTGNTPLTVAAAQGLLANDPAGSVIASVDTTNTQGTVDVTLATGAFTYNPPVGAQNVADTFTYTVTGFAPVTVTINLSERIWYVNNTSPAGGNGTFGSPFNTLAAAEAPTSDANDTIFVFTGTPTAPTDAGQNLGIDLLAGQKLLGQGVRLSFNGVPIVDSLPNAPVISNAGLLAGGDIPVVLLATGNEVAGLTINAGFNEGILALAGTGHNIHDNTFTFDPANGREGIRLLSVTGNNTVAVNTITGSPRDGIKLANNENQAGILVAATPITASVTMSRNTISGSAQDGIAVILDGAGTNVTLDILTNTITDSGTAGANEGINIDSLGDANVTAVISRNTIANSAAEAIDQGSAATSDMKAFVANNDLSASNGLADFRARTIDAGATFCLELLNNFTAAAINSTFRIENNSGDAAAFRFFEPGAGDPETNDALAVPNPLPPPDLFTHILQGDCNIFLDGAILFEANCAKCHTGNGLGLNTKKLLIAKDITNATTVMINEQMVINGSMIQEFFGAGRLRLTQAEIAAIAAALVPAP